MEEDLEELMEKFGEIVYARIVVDPNTDHSKGEKSLLVYLRKVSFCFYIINYCHFNINILMLVMI